MKQTMKVTEFLDAGGWISVYSHLDFSLEIVVKQR